MTSHFQRSIVIGALILLLLVAVPPAFDWCRDAIQLPAGYGAAGDQQFNRPMPAAVRTAVDELSEGAGGSWVQERVENGAWVYDLHLSEDGKPSVIHLRADGQVIPPIRQELETEADSTAVVGG